MPAPIALGLYSLREACAADLAGTLREVAETGYVAIEPVDFLPAVPAEKAARLAHEMGLEVCGLFAKVPPLAEVPAAAALAKSLGSRFLTGEFSGRELQDVAQVQAAAAHGQQVAEALQREGVTLTLHNHDDQYRFRLDGRYPYEVLADLAPALRFEFDTYRAAFGGADPVQAASVLRSRIPLLHAKDGMLEELTVDTAVGAGRVNVAGVIRALDPNVLKWVIVELEDCATDKLEAVRQSYAYLTQNGLAEGRR